MKIARSEQGWLVRLDTGDELPGSLLSAAESEGIRTGIVSGIGAVDQATLAYFDLAEKKYLPLVLDEPLELVSLQGNLTRVEGAPLLHAHAVVSRRDGRAVAGHLIKARVSVTLELFVARLDLPASRRLDPRWGLRLLDF